MITQTQRQEDFILLCSLFGACIKRSQGGGGNISVKEGDTLWIKASGSRLTSISSTNMNGYVGCSLTKIQDCYENNIEQLDSTVLEHSLKKPSMETFFHILPLSHIVHIHPSFFCRYLCSSEAKTIFTPAHFPNSLYIPYTKPGLALANYILPRYRNESVIFLENHGIILLSTSVELMIELYEETLLTLEKIVGQKANQSSLSTEYELRKRFGQVVKPIYDIPNLPQHFVPLSPDHFLFLQNILQIDSQVYCIAPTYDLCTNKEEYLRSYFEIYTPSTVSLSEEQQRELTVCPKEILRLSSQ